VAAVRHRPQHQPRGARRVRNCAAKKRRRKPGEQPTRGRGTQPRQARGRRASRPPPPPGGSGLAIILQECCRPVLRRPAWPWPGPDRPRVARLDHHQAAKQLLASAEPRPPSFGQRHAAAMATPWTTSWIAVDRPSTFSIWPSWVRNNAAPATATMLPTPPVIAVPPSTAAAIGASR